MQTPVWRVRGAGLSSAEDWVAVERPLELRARIGETVRVVSTTMRTPGEDRALCAGFLFSEGVIKGPPDIRALEQIDEDAVLIELGPGAEAALEATSRPFVTTGACGVCGRTRMDTLLEVCNARSNEAASAPGLRITMATVHALPAALRTAQATFARTGGLHAAGLFTLDGMARAVEEDVGRHNAVDKLVGSFLLEGQLPGPDSVLVVSGRASFELVQKAAMAGIPVMAAVGAPSSLAVEIARLAGMTLFGFVRDGGFNVYCGEERLEGVSALEPASGPGRPAAQAVSLAGAHAKAP
jgi:FdhD protein